MTLTIADIERWDAGDVREVFHAATSRAQAVQDAANGLVKLPAFGTWDGEAAEAAKKAIGRTRADLDAHGQEALAVANAARSAADEIERIRSELATLKADADALGMDINAVSGQVVADPGFSGTPVELLLKEQQLQPRVDRLIAEANLVDMALGNAIDMASGETPIPPAAGEQPNVPNQRSADVLGKPDTVLQDILFPPTSEATDPAKTGQSATPSPTALDRLLVQHNGTGEPGDSTRTTRSPLTAPIVGADPSAVDRQLAKVEAAQQKVDAAQATLDDAAAQTYTQGAGAGRGATDLLAQQLFDARHELTDQTRILEELNLAVVETGARPVEVPPLPPNADVQALPPEPSKFAEGSRALSEGSFGVIPDVAKTADVLTNWGEHSGAEQSEAVLNVAGMVPLPGGKLVTEALEHGLDALGTAARHSDDIPTPHVDVDDAPTGGDAPTVDTPDNPVDDIGPVTPYGLEDTSALLAASEASGGHLIERHVGQTFDELSARLATTRLETVSTFLSTDEASAAVGSALRHNQQTIEDWVSDGAEGKIDLDAPFTGGELLHRGTAETIAGSGVRVVLKGDGTGGWYLLTGFPTS
ncbi:hypothetical protein BH09ACT7_BH09ACT7_56370 [soil metagenome]